MSASDFSLTSYVGLAGAGVLVILGSGLIAWPLARLFDFQWKTFVPPMMFTNSGNMGVPLILLAFGEAALPAAIVLFALENFLHFTLGQQMINHRTSMVSLIKNPMVIATIGGIGFSVIGVSLSEFKDWKIGVVSALVCPLSGLLIAILILPLFSLPAEQVPVLILFSILPPAIPIILWFIL